MRFPLFRGLGAMLQIYERRREKLRELMAGAGLSALLVLLDANRYYLSGFELHDVQVDESAGYLLVQSNGEDWLLTDARYLDTARRIWNENHIYIYPSLISAPEHINKLCKDLVVRCLGFEAKMMSVAFYERFRLGLRLASGDGLVEKVRIIKDNDEIKRLEESAALNHALMNWVPGILQPGRSEAEVAWDIERFFRERGATENAFAPIVAVGPNAALPHATPGTTLITDNCPVLVDVGARLNDYNSDQTRTFWVGATPLPEFTKTMDLVREAQARAIAGIGPGVPCSEVYALAKDYLDAQGVGVFFTHGLGHGVGLQTHEAPSLGSRSKHILAPGMVVTVEPGLYYPDWGGVRWEYMVLVTEDGHRVL
jgi:Xaa-Pro aminopeptidase